MKKRLLALALAGTTAFSVFGGLTAFASTEDDVYASYNLYDLTTGKLVADADDFETVMDIEDIMDTEVVDGVVYLYDFFEVFADAGYDVEDFEEFEEGENADTVIAKFGGLDGKDYDYGEGDRRSIRKDIISAWDEFIDGISKDLADYSYKFEKEDIYNFEGLMADIVYADDNATKMISSQLVYLMQQYDYFVDGGLVDAKAFDTEDLDIVMEILAGRTEDDFKKANDYNRGWVFALEDLEKAYEKADTTAEYGAVWADAIDYLFNYSGADKADKSALKAAAKTTLLGFELYPAADFADKDTTSGYTAEYDYYQDVLTFATMIIDNATSQSFQSDVDVATEMLEDAIAALEPTNSNKVKGSTLMMIEEAMEEFDGLVESDYKKGWSDLETALEYAEDALAGDKGLNQTWTALDMLGNVTLTAKSVPASLRKELKTAINAAQKWVNAYKKNYTSDKTAAQVLAVKNALENGNKVYSADAKLISKFEAAIDQINDALNYTEVTLGWVETEKGWAYGTEEGFVQNGWYKVKDNWCYFENGVALANTWKNLDGTWYYLNSYCFAARGWAKVDGKWYFFNDGCAMLANTTVDGYVLSASGAMVE